MKRGIVAVGLGILSVFAASVAAAGSYHWVGGDQTSGGTWNTAANWVNDATLVSEVPTPGSTVVITNAIVADDDDAALFASLQKIRLDRWIPGQQKGAVLTLDISTNVTIGCAVSGQGRWVKRGAGSATLTCVDKAQAFVIYHETYGVYYVAGGGIHVEEGALLLADSGSDVLNYGSVHVAEDAIVIMNDCAITCIEALYGSGTVRYDGATQRALQIAYYGMSLPIAAVFSGKLTGNIRVDIRGNQILSGEENDFTGSVQAIWGKGQAAFGRLGVTKLGMLGEASSLGKANSFLFLAYGGHFAYLGSGETSDRMFVTDARSNTGLMPQYFDGGTNGGLRLTGYMDLRSYGGEYKMRSFVFTGSNETACTMAGPFKLSMDDSNGVGCDFYVRKEGPGEWSFEENADTTFRGVFDVREGTLSFDSITNAGELCALGYSTRLSDEFTGAWDDAPPSRYAFRVGTTNLVGAAPAVFAFVGGKSCASSDRPMLLTGDAHFRADGKDGAAVDFADVSAAAGDGVKTLVLDGTNTADNVLRGVADGAGRVSVVKEGSGKWTLRGDQTFSGTLSVKAGELAVRDRVPYSWYRIIFRKNVAQGCEAALSRLAFYDSEGKLLTGGISFVHGQQYGTEAYRYYAVDPSTLQPGQCAYVPFSSTPESDNYWSKLNLEDPGVLFKGGGAGGSRIYYYNGDTIQSFDTGYVGARLVVRLPEGSPEAVRYDLATWIPDGWISYRPTSWTVEGSLDGVDWVELDSVDGKDDVTETGVWYSDPSTAASGEDRPDAGFSFDLPEVADQLGGIESVSVAAGAKLTIGAESAMPAIGKIVIDAATGAGTISGGSFAENLVVDIVGEVPRRGVSLPLDFAGVGNIGDLQPVFKIGGETTGRYSFSMTADELTVKPVGLILFMK